MKKPALLAGLLRYRYGDSKFKARVSANRMARRILFSHAVKRVHSRPQ